MTDKPKSNNRNDNLVSVIIPVYNTEKFFSRCVESVLAQTYTNLEIIVVNDGSKGDIKNIVEGYRQKCHNLKIINLDKNQGLFAARLVGIKESKGDYILNLDSDDALSIDYVRALIDVATDNLSDIVIPETVEKNEQGSFIYNLANELPFDYLETKQILDQYFGQKGENYLVHIGAGRLYSRRLVDNAMPHFDKIKKHIIMCEDVLYSTIFWGLADRIDRSRTSYYYYYRHENSSTGYNSVESIKKKIMDINNVFNEIKNFLKQQNKYLKYKDDLIDWQNIYSYEYHSVIRNTKITENEKKILEKLIKFGNNGWEHRTASGFYRLKTKFDDSLEKLKIQITDKKTQIVSFDIFDTLVTRPFMRPSDLFYLLDSDFKLLDKKFRLDNFYNIRIKCEEMARSLNSDNEDISLLHIYEVMQKEYFVEKDVAEKMLLKELEFEIKFCKQRMVSKEVYDLVMFLGKKIIITSDMYLPLETIKTILENCGFSDYDKLYVSSDSGTMKATTSLYKTITKELNIPAENMLHIGDNYDSDIVAANTVGWQTFYLPKTTDILPNFLNNVFGDSSIYAYNHLGIRCSYAVAMNKIFDNPFISFNKESNYNCSPYFTGYFALGLAMLGFTQWIINDSTKKNIKSMVFLGRDGYLPMQIFELFSFKGLTSVKINYLPTSRKATIPLSIFGPANLAEIKTFNYRGYITDSILSSISDYKTINTNKKTLDIDFNKVKKLQSSFINTYKKYFDGKTAVVDIGYSGRPEQIYSELFQKKLYTYFMFSDNDEAKRRLGKNVSIYSRLKLAAIKEKIISELSGSCTRYEIDKNKVIPVFDNSNPASYYEKYVILEMQRAVKDFITKYLDFFGEHTESLYLGDSILNTHPLDQATTNPLHIDKEIFWGFKMEDDVAGDNIIDLYEKYFTEKVSLAPENDLNYLRSEIQSFLGIRRSAKLLAGNIKRRIMYGKNR